MPSSKKPKTSKTKASAPSNKLASKKGKRVSKKTTPPSKPSSTKMKKKKSIVGFLFKWIFVLGLWLSIIASGILAWYAAELPDITRSADFERKASITVLASDDRQIMRFGEIKGNTVDISELPNNLINAVLSIEDRRFFSHFGIDIFGVARAMVVNIHQGRFVQGGSTITQQLAKNLFLSHKRTLKRKIQEAMLAIWLERQLSKDEILTAYLNRVYLGSGAYGVDAASQLYFDKDVRDISLQESATLAGLLKAPSRYSPLRNPGLANKRASIVLEAMVDAGYITSSEAKGLKNTPPRPSKKPEGGDASRYFADWIIDGLGELIGTPEADLIIETTLDLSLQRKAEKVLRDKLLEHGTEKNISQGAILISATDGAVLAMVGGTDYKASQFNRTTQAKRPPGSAFKPFVYLTALEQGWQTNSKILDAPIEDASYTPQNYNENYLGIVSLKTALSKSLNTAAVRLMNEIGRSNVIETARLTGIISPIPNDLSVALGSAAVSPLEITAAYGSFANGGYSVFPYGITKISDANGTIYYQRPSETVSRKIISSSAQRKLKDMLKNVIDEGTGRAAALSIPVYGKTGTSQNFRDAWFVGFTDKVIGTVWLGNDNNAPMIGVTGGSIPAQIWKSTMQAAHDASQERKIINVDDGNGFGGLLGRILSTNPEITPGQDSHKNTERYNN